MRKTAITLLVLSLFINTVSAQLYLNLGMGFAIAQAGGSYDWQGTPFNGTRNTVSATNSSYTYNVKGASFSSGLWGDIGFGYMGGRNIGFQFDAGIGLANKKYTFTDQNIIDPLTGGLGNENIVQQAKTPFIVMPSLVIQSGGDPVNFYGRLGVALPLNTKITQDQVYTTLPGQGALEIDDFTYQLKSSFSLGFTAAAGIQYQLNDRLKIWGEVSLLSLSVFIKESDIQSWAENGQSVPLSYYAPNPTVVKYSKNAVVDSPYAQLPAYTLPFSNVAFNVGVTFRLTDKKEPSKHHIKSDNARLREERDN